MCLIRLQNHFFPFKSVRADNEFRFLRSNQYYSQRLANVNSFSWLDMIQYVASILSIVSTQVAIHVQPSCIASERLCGLNYSPRHRFRAAAGSGTCYQSDRLNLIMQKAIRDRVLMAWEATGPGTGLMQKKHSEKKIDSPQHKDMKVKKQDVSRESVDVDLTMMLYEFHVVVPNFVR